MQVEPPASPYIAIWRKLILFLRQLTAPHGYVNLSPDDHRRIRALNVTILLLGSIILLVMLPFYLLLPPNTHTPQQYTITASFGMMCIIGYVLVRRGMWKTTMRLIFWGLFIITTSFAIYMGIEGISTLYYLIFMVAWTAFFMAWREWILIILLNIGAVLLYILILPEATFLGMFRSLFLFTVIGNGILVAVRLYQDYSTARYLTWIAESEARLRTTIEASADGYYLLQAVYDTHGAVIDFRIIEINSAACDQLKMSREHLLNGLICELFPVNEAGGFFEQYKAVLQTGEPLEQEYFIPTGHVGTGWYYHQVVQVRDGLVIMNRNITQRKQFEMDLVKRQNRLQSLVESQSAFLVRIDLSGKYTYANQRFLDSFGYSAQTIIGIDSLRTIHPDDIQKVLLTTENCFKTPGRPASVTIRKPNKDGGYFWTDWEFTAILDNMGKIIEVQCVGLDATARTEAEQARIESAQLRYELEQQEELNQIKNRMMTRISHEFRTPLSIIRSSTNLMERYSDRMSEYKRQEKLTHINQEIDRLVAIVTDMGRILDGQTTAYITLTGCDLPDIIRQAIIRHEKTHGSSQQIVFSATDPFPIVLLDAHQIVIILDNLIGNALKYSPKNSPIAISLTHDSQIITLTVSDKGIGILPSELPNIYEPFFRGTNFGEVGGMGLGLSLVKSAVESHDGDITIISTPNIGTTVTVTLPMTPMKEE
jgi:PAS domain S-box-containing protein